MQNKFQSLKVISFNSRAVICSAFVFGFGCILCLTLPWFIGVSQSISDSYYYGYSNKSALFILLITIFSSYYIVSRVSKNTAEWSNRRVEETTTYNFFRQKKFVFFIYSFLFLGFIIFLFISYNLQNSIYYGESGYFIKRLYLMKDGLDPFISFEFAYGSFLLYFPHYIKELFNLQVETSYLLSLFLESVAGYFFLWKVCKTLGSGGNLHLLFILLLLPSFFCLFSGGANYTLFRFVTPIYLLTYIVHDKVRSSQIRVILLSIFIFLIVINISVELSITSMFSIIIFNLYLNKYSKKAFVTSLILIILVLGIFIYSESLGSKFKTLLIFSQGGNNFPWYLSPSILGFFVFIFTSIVIVALSRSKNYHLMVLIYSILNLPGALGRCDIGHIYFYGIGFFIINLSSLEYLYSSYLRKYILVSYISLYVVFLSGGIMYLLYGAYWPQYSYFVKQRIKFHIGMRLDPLKKSSSSYDSALTTLDEKPLVLRSDPIYFLNSPLRVKLDFPYFIDGMNDFSLYSKKVLLEEILKHKFVIVPKSRESVCSFYPLDFGYRVILFGSPSFHKYKNDPSLLNDKICSTLQKFYSISDIKLDSDNFLLVRNTL